MEGLVGLLQPSRMLHAGSTSRGASAREALKRPRPGSTPMERGGGVVKEADGDQCCFNDKDVAIRFAVFCGPTTTGSCRTPKKMEQMMKELVEEEERWDVEPKPVVVGFIYG